MDANYRKLIIGNAIFKVPQVKYFSTKGRSSLDYRKETPKDEILTHKNVFLDFVQHMLMVESALYSIFMVMFPLNVKQMTSLRFT